jgi:hypothetical protein
MDLTNNIEFINLGSGREGIMKKTAVIIALALVSSGLVFTQSIRVTQPARGQQFRTGQAMSIHWTASGISGHLAMALVKTDQTKRYMINLRIPQNRKTVSYRIPASVVPGNYYVVVGCGKTAGMSAVFTIQKPSQQALNRTSMRTKAAPIKPKPDLVITRVDVSDRTPPYNEIRSRDELHFLVTVKNIGNKASVNDFYIGFSHWGCNTGTWKWQRMHLGVLDPGKTVEMIIEVRGHDLPNGWKENPNLCVKVDARNQIQESRESNNVKSLRVTVVD